MSTLEISPELLQSLPSSALVVFDVDNTLANGTSPSEEIFEIRPGAIDLITSLVQEGHRVYIWSAGGEKHAKEVSIAMDIDRIVEGYFRKPSYPMQPDAVRDIFGQLPDLTIDDDYGEAIEGVPFSLTECWWGKLAD